MYDKFRICKVEVKNKLELKTKILKFDRGGEYNENYLKVFGEDNGLIHEVKLPC